jgi:hypothetical protein
MPDMGVREQDAKDLDAFIYTLRQGFKGYDR